MHGGWGTGLEEDVEWIPTQRLSRNRFRGIEQQEGEGARKHINIILDKPTTSIIGLH
jgi:hypothetical protein